MTNDNDATRRPVRDIADIYELSPIQQGLLYEQLAQPGLGIYIEQLRLEFTGTIHPGHFERAWQLVVDRHPLLRSSFHWRRDGTVLQVVHGAVDLPTEVLDWRDLDEATQRTRLATQLDEERAVGFDLAAAPLMRNTLIRRVDERWTFSWRFSHLLMDGWSFTLAIEDFLTHYRQLCRGEQPDPLPGRPYRDYLGWWRERDTGPDREFWQAELAGYQPVEHLYLGGLGEEAGARTHGYFERVLGELAPRLSTVARAEQLTLATLAQGAWFLVLGRFLGRADLACGITMAHRPPDLHGSTEILGPMIATVPVRRTLEPTMLVRSWLRDFGRHVQEASTHTAVALPDLQGLVGTAAALPLLQSSVSYENVPMPDFDLSELGAEMVELSYDGRPHFPITMVIMPGEQMPLRVLYDRRSVGDDIAARFADEVVSVLEQIVTRPAATLDELTFDGIPAHAATTFAEPDTECLHETLRRHARTDPDAIAVVCGEHTLTYGALVERSGRVAAALRDRCPGATRIGLCLPRSTDLVAAMIGVLEVGAAYVPLDPNHPPARLADTLADCGAEAVIVDDDTASALVPDGDTPLLTRTEIARYQADPAAPRAADPEAPAYLLYTSGSTGRPKGVPISHRHVQCLLAAGRQVFGFAAEDVWTCAHSVAFDYSVWEIWGALGNGGRLIVVTSATTRDPRALARTVAEQGVTVLSATPALFEHVAPELTLDGALRKVFLGGDRLDPALVRPRFAEFHRRGIELYNLYGVTEATVVSTYHLIREHDLRTDAPIPIGRALPDQRVVLLGENDRPVPAGATGQLCVAGPAVAGGYHARGELTARRFGLDPDGQPLYRTGDLATCSVDGEIRFLGRADSQVKLRGFRVELGEIEAVLRSAPGVRSAAIIAPGGPRADRLLGYAVPERPFPTTEPRLAEHLAGFLRDRLPEHMVPAAVYWIDRIPTTVGGKVDLSAFPVADAVTVGEFTAARTESEHLVARLLAEVLDLPRVGAGDIVRELGLHSLAAMRLVGRLRGEYALEPDLSELMAASTVADLARVVDAARPILVRENR
ncbi:amino acid adenylation domain-containing protein [Nocardia sp. AG03]|uniref:non-ribosomal peptide synthetase n=1 Tax=Nocardia sp. AG03 TaxID=3025312 RepID=UPI0024182DD2|nr:amino acid adenylation domain-containing protein [Nocardia sp. AG03]